MIKRIMGLDASTSTIGLAVVEINDGKLSLAHMEYWKPPKGGSIFERMASARTWLEGKLKTWTPEEVVIEDFLMGHSKTNIKTLMSLAIFNRGVGMVVYDCLKKDPIYLVPITIRSRLQLGDVRPSKEDMPELVAKHLKIDFPYVYGKKGKLLKENFDMSDSLGAALGFLLGPRKKVKKNASRKKVVSL